MVEFAHQKSAEPKSAKIVKQFMTGFKETIKLGGHQYPLNDVLFNRLLDILSARSRKTTLMAHYTGVDGRPKYVQNKNPKLGNVIKNEPNRHAEKVFIDEYLAAITSVATEYNLRTGQKSSLYITMNRSSCNAMPHRLAGSTGLKPSDKGIKPFGLRWQNIYLALGAK